MDQPFANLYFGKSIDDIQPEDLKEFFREERPEGINLEFKSFAQREGDIKHKEKGVLRTICAFLNSEGGLLIWGAPEGSENELGEKVFVGELSPVTKYYAKDSFISKFITRLEDVPSGIRFKDIKVGDKEWVYLIDVPESSIKPHQFEDRYWTRYDGQSKAAPHHLVRALFREVKRPILKPTLTLDRRLASFLMGSSYRIVDIPLHVRVDNLVESVNEIKPFVILASEQGGFVTDNKELLFEQQLLLKPHSKVLAYDFPMQFFETYRIDRDSYKGQSSIRFTIKLVTGGHHSAPVRMVKNYRVMFFQDGRIELDELAEGD